ncbi:MAG: ATP-binding protein [Cyclobacteriaceae bacterium]
MVIQEKNIQRLILQDIQNSSLVFLNWVKTILDGHPEVTSMMMRFPFLLGIVDANGNFQYVNGHCMEHFPVNKRNAAEINAYDAFKDLPAFVFSMRQAIHGVVRKEVVPVDRKDLVGWFFPMSSDDIGGQGTLALIFKTRVSQMVTEKDLQFYRSHFAKAQRIGRIGVWEWDLKTDLVYWSSETYRLHGFSDFSFEPTINSALDFVHPADRNKLIGAINEALNKQKGYDVEYRVMLSDGQTKYHKVDTELVVDDEGETVKVFGIVQDITDKKLAENKLENTNKRIHAILENIPNAFVSVNSDWKIIYANKLIEGLLKTSRRKLVGKNLWMLFPDDIGQECVMKLSEAIENDKEGKHEVYFDSLQSWFEISVNHGPEGYLVFFNDVTKHKRLENTLRDLNEAKNQFFNIIAHDLKSPFNSIMGLTELIEKAPDALSEAELTAVMGRLGKNTRNVYKMLENLLLWSRNQMNQLDLEFGSYDMQEIIDSNLELFAPKAEEKNINLESNVDCPVHFYGDKNAVDTIIRNLLNNALKFTPGGGKITWNCEDTESELIVSVSDTGVGMEDEVIETIFRNRNSYSSNGTDGEKGTGLGLKLCHDLADNLGGKMWVKSSMEGTTIYLSLSKATAKGDVVSI